MLRCKELRRLVRKWSPYYWVLMKKSVRKYKYISQILLLTRKNKNNINVVFTFIVYFYKQCEDSGPRRIIWASFGQDRLKSSADSGPKQVYGDHEMGLQVTSNPPHILWTLAKWLFETGVG